MPTPLYIFKISCMHNTIHTMPRVLLYTFLLAFYFPPIQNPLGFSTKADDRLMQIECHHANAPTTCIKCLKSHNRSLNADKYTIATLVVECLEKHANDLAGNMSVLSSRISQHKGSKKAYEDCGKLFSKANKELEFAAKNIMNGDYNGADRFVFGARTYNLECYGNVVKSRNESELGVPSAVRSEMMVFEELCEAVMRIIERF